MNANMQSDSFSENSRSKAAEFYQVLNGWVSAFFGQIEYALSRLGDLILGVRVGILLQQYAAAGCPDRYLKERPNDTRAAELRNVSLLQPFWAPIRVRRISLAKCYQYFR